jgi:hypothetical protein
MTGEITVAMTVELPGARAEAGCRADTVAFARAG